MRTESDGDQRRELFLALESLAGTAAVLLDAGGTLEHGNRQACELLDCASEELLAARWKAISPSFALPPNRPFPAKPVAVTADVAFNGELRSLGFEWHAIGAETGSGHFVLLKDRGVLDNLERELLLASERRGWSHQCATLMHDLKGILNSMQISLELLSSVDGAAPEGPEDARRQRRITTLKDDLTRMNLTLRGLPGTEGDAEPPVDDFDARDVVREIFVTLRQLVRRNSVELKLDLPQAPLPVRGRRAWIRQALFNVVVHRLNAMRAGGRLSVEALATDRGVSVKLGQDTPGMREGMIEDSARRFCPGRTNGAATDLQVARSIFESQGGALEIEDGADGGAVIVMHLPR